MTGNMKLLATRFVSFCGLILLFSMNVFAQDYRGQDISNLDLSGQNLSGALFDENTTFSNGNTGVNLSGTGLNLNLIPIPTGSDFRGVNLSGCNWNSGGHSLR